MTKLALLFLFTLLLPPLRPQAGPPARLTAEQMLDRAIRQQGPAEVTKPGAVRDFTISIAVRAWNYEEDPPQRLALQVRRFLSLDPELFRSECRSGAGVQLQGFDGRRFWYADDEGSRFLLGDDAEQGRRDVREQIVETRHLLRMFFLANLRGPDVRWRRMEPDTIKEPFHVATPCEVLQRVNGAPDSKDPPLTLWFEAQTYRLRKALLAGTDRILFYFQYDEQSQPRVKGVLFPCQIQIWEQPKGSPEPRRSVVATVHDGGGVTFNSGLSAELFRRPKAD